MSNTKYGITRNRKFEQQLRDEFGYMSTFTYEQAKEAYHRTHPGDTVFVGMNPTRYIAAMVTFGLVKRVERGLYQWLVQSNVDKQYMLFFEHHVIDDRREYDLSEMRSSYPDLSDAEVQQLYDKVQAYFA